MGNGEEKSRAARDASSRWGDAANTAIRSDGHAWWARVGRGGGKSPPRKAQAGPEGPGARSGSKRCRETASEECLGRPYRKPTQVGEESILRRSGEPVRRNSAKWPRNFGKRGAPFGQVLRGWKLFGAAENRPGRLFTKNTCLC